MVKIINNKIIQFELRDLDSKDIKKLEKAFIGMPSLDWVLEVYCMEELDKIEETNK